MQDYLIRSLIYFIIINASMYLWDLTHPDNGGANRLAKAMIARMCVSLIPIFRFTIVCVIIVMLFVPNEKLKEITKRKK